MDELKTKIAELRNRQAASYPRTDPDGCLIAETHDELAHAFRNAYDKLERVVEDALKLLDQLAAGSPS